MINIKKINYKSGAILPTAMIMGVAGMFITGSYMNHALNKKLNLDFQIAQTKAKYNAETGLAKAFRLLTSADDWTGEYDSVTFAGKHLVNESMGYWENVRLYEDINDKSKKTERYAKAYGSKKVKTIWGGTKTILDSAIMTLEIQTLAEYMYLTNHENAGGAPGIYGTQGSQSNTQRGKPCFGGDDVLGNNLKLAGYVQTMDPILICSQEPSFNNLVYITRADEEFVNSIYNTTNVAVGDSIMPDWSLCGCDADDIFLSEDGPEAHPGYVIKDKICFPLEGYYDSVNNAKAEHIYDSTEMMRYSNQSNIETATKDTLIMTDIEFLAEGGYRVKRWWYLMPPHLKANILKCGDENATPSPTTTCNGQYDNPIYTHPQPQHLEGAPQLDGLTDAQKNAARGLINGECDTGGDIATDFQGGDITQCDYYEDPLRDFHSLKMTTHPGNPSNNNFNNQFETDYGNYTYSQGPGGGVTRLSHYDVENFTDYYEWKDASNNSRDHNNAAHLAARWDEPTLIFDKTTPYANGGNLIEDAIKNPPNNEAVIYIKGGPVRVHGVYKGRYTLVTSGYDVVGGHNEIALETNALYNGWATYKRHAQVRHQAPLIEQEIDTVRTNIWITGDLVNADAAGFNAYPPQPDVYDEDGNVVCLYSEPGDCGSSKNVLGLVSAANVIIANNDEEVGNNRSGGINLHAHIVALNESFVMHYWQHSLDDPANDYDTSPQTDQRGRDLYGADNNELRGDVRLWGGIIQTFRGYMKRSATGPYNSGFIGMDKAYNYDNNLYFPPPHYPYMVACSEIPHVNFNWTQYGPIIKD